MTINMVSKSGSDKFHGSGYYYAEGQTFESNNLDSALRLAVSLPSASAGSPLQHFIDQGAGGLRSHWRQCCKLWFWAQTKRSSPTATIRSSCKTRSSGLAAGNQLAYSWRTVRSCTNSDPADLKHVDYKLSWSPFHHNTFTFQNGYSTKDQQHFMFSTPDRLKPRSTLYSPCCNQIPFDRAYRDRDGSPI